MTASKAIYLGMQYRGTMTQDDGTGQAVPGADVDGPPEEASVETIESYDVGDEVVLYDSENPLAWVRTDHAVRLTDNE